MIRFVYLVNEGPVMAWPREISLLRLPAKAFGDGGRSARMLKAYGSQQRAVEDRDRTSCSLLVEMFS